MSTDIIAAVRITEHGGIDQLTLVDQPVPTTRPGEVLVRVVASSINPVDCKTRAWAGMGPELPATLGWDLAGIVVESTVAEFATIIIPLVVSFALQRFFVRGLPAGATKG